MVDQMRLLNLLKNDPIYKGWFQKPPAPFKVFVPTQNRPWRVFVQEKANGKWVKIDTPGYAQAYTQVKARLRDSWDLTIHSCPQAWNPPVVKIGKKRFYNPMPLGHNWCSFCRRPTVFRRFKRHHNIPCAISSEEKRCNICGIRLSSLKEYTMSLDWPLVP